MYVKPLACWMCHGRGGDDDHTAKPMNSLVTQSSLISVCVCVCHCISIQRFGMVSTQSMTHEHWDTQWPNNKNKTIVTVVKTVLDISNKFYLPSVHTHILLPLPNVSTPRLVARGWWLWDTGDTEALPDPSRCLVSSYHTKHLRQWCVAGYDWCDPRCWCMSRRMCVGWCLCVCSYQHYTRDYQTVNPRGEAERVMFYYSVPADARSSVTQHVVPPAGDRGPHAETISSSPWPA